MNYIAKVLSKKETRPGCWNHLEVGVFEVADDGTEKQVGRYERKYSTMYDTFFAFQQKGKWYALYSSDYTATSVMSLPDCKQIATEEGNANGFCPTGFYVPTLDDISEWNIYYLYMKEGKRAEAEAWLAKSAHNKENKEEYERFEREKLGTFGFVCGCHWGDDSSWKLQYLDLSKIDEGVITRTDRWGYLELPNKMKLKDCFDFHGFEPFGGEDIEVCTRKVISVLDRTYWGDPEIGDVFHFTTGSIFNGAKVRIKKMTLESWLCEIIECKDIKESEIWLDKYLVKKYAKKVEEVKV